jgi:hypothetical protein
MNLLKDLSDFQFRYSKAILIFAIVMTLFLGAGLTKISMQSDLDKMMPQDLEIYQISNSIEDNFGGQDASIILLRIEGTEKSGVYDIRDPRVIKFLVELGDALEDEDLIESVQSVGMGFSEETIPPTLEVSKQIFRSIPAFSNFFNKDYSATIAVIGADLGGGEEKIKEMESLIDKKLSEISHPENVEVYITGTPQIRSMMIDILASDAIFTLSIAAVIIFLLLIVMERSFTKATLVFIPLLLGIVWTLGIMGWLGIQLSIATVGIGAMILGLGVEYGVFIVSRYSEERENNSSKIALQTAVAEVGSSILGSGTTTIAGFLALTFSIMPMLRDLGLSLAIGIGFSLLAAVFVNPSLIILEESLEHWRTERQHKQVIKKQEHHKRRKQLDEKDN